MSISDCIVRRVRVISIENNKIIRKKSSGGYVILAVKRAQRGMAKLNQAYDPHKKKDRREKEEEKNAKKENNTQCGIMRKYVV